MRSPDTFFNYKLLISLCIYIVPGIIISERVLFKKRAEKNSEIRDFIERVEKWWLD